MKILIVEDDAKILLSLTVRLRSAGHEVATAQDGVSGTAAAVKEKPDLVLLDVSMPAGDGFKVAERMQQNAATVGTPVIFMTASRKPGIRQRGHVGPQILDRRPMAVERGPAHSRSLRQSGVGELIAHR